jgi:hypothetical protein
VITCSMRNVAILSRTSASKDLSRGCLALISRYNNLTNPHTYIGGYQTCVVLISKNCAQLQVLQMKIPRKYLHMCATIF